MPSKYRKSKRIKDCKMVNDALRIIKNRAIAGLVSRCIEAAAELYEVGPAEIMAPTRGVREVARARVVAMNAALMLGVPIGRTAKAFRRSRRCVRSCLHLGREGREERDADVLHGARRVIVEVGKKMAASPASLPSEGNA
jgi:hypothetical protein